MTDRTVRERGFLAPFATYDDGTTGFAWPEIIHGPASAVNALMRNPVPYLSQSPEDRQQTIGNAFEAAGAAAVGGSIAPRPMNALAANGMLGRFSPRMRRAFDVYVQHKGDVDSAKRFYPEHAAELEDLRGRPYRQTKTEARSINRLTDDLAAAADSRPWDVEDIAARIAELKPPPHPHQAYRGSQFEAPNPKATEYWASDNPHVAGTYALPIEEGANIAPVEFRFSNPLVVDARGERWTHVPFGDSSMTTNEIVDLARGKHDGVVFRNVRDNRNAQTDGLPQTTYAALERGTSYSPLTGDLLYSNGNPALGVVNALMRYRGQQDRYDR